MSRTFGSRTGYGVPLASLAILAIGGVVALACTTDYQKGVDDPIFGAPEALAGRKPPGRTGAVGTGDGDGGGGAAGGPGCVSEGKALVDGGACAVTFSQVMATFDNAGCGNSGCHNAGSIYDPQPIDTSNPDALYALLTNFKLSNGLYYVNPCSTNIDESSLHCNLDTLGTCGTRMPSGRTFPPQDLNAVKLWVECGAPKNLEDAGAP